MADSVEAATPGTAAIADLSDVGVDGESTKAKTPRMVEDVPTKAEAKRKALSRAIRSNFRLLKEVSNSVSGSGGHYLIDKFPYPRKMGGNYFEGQFVALGVCVYQELLREEICVNRHRGRSISEALRREFESLRKMRGWFRMMEGLHSCFTYLMGRSASPGSIRRALGDLAPVWKVDAAGNKTRVVLDDLWRHFMLEYDAKMTAAKQKADAKKAKTTLSGHQTPEENATMHEAQHQAARTELGPAEQQPHLALANVQAASITEKASDTAIEDQASPAASATKVCESVNFESAVAKVKGSPDVQASAALASSDTCCANGTSSNTHTREPGGAEGMDQAYNPPLPSFRPTSPPTSPQFSSVYAPTSPNYSAPPPPSPRYSPESPQYSLPNPALSPASSPKYSPASLGHGGVYQYPSGDSPKYSPTSSTHSQQLRTSSSSPRGHTRIEHPISPLLLPTSHSPQAPVQQPSAPNKITSQKVMAETDRDEPRANAARDIKRRRQVIQARIEANFTALLDSGSRIIALTGDFYPGQDVAMDIIALQKQVRDIQGHRSMDTEEKKNFRKDIEEIADLEDWDELHRRFNRYIDKWFPGLRPNSTTLSPAVRLLDSQGESRKMAPTTTQGQRTSRRKTFAWQVALPSFSGGLTTTTPQPSLHSEASSPSQRTENIKRERQDEDSGDEPVFISHTKKSAKTPGSTNEHKPFANTASMNHENTTNTPQPASSIANVGEAANSAKAKEKARKKRKLDLEEIQLKREELALRRQALEDEDDD